MHAETAVRGERVKRRHGNFPSALRGFEGLTDEIGTRMESLFTNVEVN